MLQALRRLKPTRRWLQFRLRTMLLATTIVAMVVAWPQIHRQYVRWRLEAYVGMDLRHLPSEERQRVCDGIDLLMGAKKMPPLFIDFRPNYWLIHRSDAVEADNHLILAEMNLAISNPGESFCSLHRIDSRGKLVGTTTFSVGYRAWPEAAKFDETRPGLLCLVVETTGPWSGETRQFYLIGDDHAELLRSEERDGTLCTGNGNIFDHLEKPSDWSQWQALVSADDTVSQLRGLAAFWSYDTQNSLKPVTDHTRRCLEHLSKSNDPWIREESAAALELLANRKFLPAKNP